MIENFIREFTAAAHEKGIKNLEFYTEEMQKSSLEVYQGKVQDRQLCKTQACYVRGDYQGKEGSVYIEDFSEEQFEREMKIICENAEAIEKVFVPLQLQTLECSKNEKEYDIQKMEEQMTVAEKEIKQAFPELEKLDTIYFGETLKKIVIQNDSGVRMEDSVRNMSAGCQAQAKKDGKVQSAYSGICKEYIEPHELEKPVGKAAENAVRMLEAGPVETGKYPVILSAGVINEMLSMYIGSFSAEQVHQGLSKMEGKRGTLVAADHIMLVEDPQLSGGVNNRSFDDEGVVTSRKNLIDRGVLQEYLYNCAEAQKDQRKSTGNGFKSDCRTTSSIGVTNLKLTGKEMSLKNLKQNMGNGLYIVSCDGMFAGANTVSGDFSLISKGYLLEDGKEIRGVNQITVAGNFFDMLKTIEGISDAYSTLLTENGAFIASDIFAGELTVSGV